MSLSDISRVQSDMVRAATRARELGFDWLQLHFAHGYLAQNFWSPLSNHRTDHYGGSAENRGRYLLETLIAVRKIWPENKPLTARFSVVEFHGDDEQMLTESIDLLKRMKAEGLDSVDVSIGFNTPEAKIPWVPIFSATLPREYCVKQDCQVLRAGTLMALKEPIALFEMGK